MVTAQEFPEAPSQSPIHPVLAQSMFDLITQVKPTIPIDLKYPEIKILTVKFKQRAL